MSGYVDLFNEAGFLGHQATADFLTVTSDATIGGTLTLPKMTPHATLSIDANRQLVGTVLGNTSIIGTDGEGDLQSLAITSSTGMLASVSGVNLNINTPQDLRISATPSFTGLTLPAVTSALPLRLDASHAVIAAPIALNSAEVSNTLPVARGGTNSTASLTNDRLMLSAGGSITEAPALANGQLFVGRSGTSPLATTITGTANRVIVTTGSGSISLSAPQDLHTLAFPTFTGILLWPTTSTPPNFGTLEYSATLGMSMVDQNTAGILGY